MNTVKMMVATITRTVLARSSSGPGHVTRRISAVTPPPRGFRLQGLPWCLDLVKAIAFAMVNASHTDMGLETDDTVRVAASK